MSEPLPQVEPANQSSSRDLVARSTCSAPTRRPPRRLMQGLAAQALMVVQVVALATVFAGRQAEPWLARLGIQLPPDTWRTLEEKKMMVLLGIWFGGERAGLAHWHALETGCGVKAVLMRVWPKARWACVLWC